MKQMEVTPQDAAALVQVLAALKTGKWTLECEEILAFGQAITWALRLSNRLKLALEAPDTTIVVAPAAETAHVERTHDVPAGRKARKGV